MDTESVSSVNCRDGSKPYFSLYRIILLSLYNGRVQYILDVLTQARLTLLTHRFILCVLIHTRGTVAWIMCGME